ncbi:hypothetical protein [Frigidibacter sp. MR17.24]
MAEFVFIGIMTRIARDAEVSLAAAGTDVSIHALAVAWPRRC